MTRIAVVAGDGIGTEVVAQGLKVLGAVLPGGIETNDYDLGAARYHRTGEVLPDSVLAELAGHDAILLGAVGDPTVPPGVLERGLLLKLRFEFDQYVNLRPSRLWPGTVSPLAGLKPGEIDLVVVREGTEGLYVGAGGNLHKDTPAWLLWQIDAAAGVATSDRGHTVRIAPFHGVAGVAWDEPGEHSTIPPRAVGGGNIDCKELVAGSTLYLPVAVPGALLSIGDGHAAQGDGEVAGTAIECGMTTELQLGLVTARPVPGVHAETPAGNAVTGRQSAARWPSEAMTCARPSLHRCSASAR